MASTCWHSCASPDDLVEKAVTRIGAAADEAIARRGVFRLVLAGGDTPTRVYRALAALPADWSRWHLWFGDERCLPKDDPGRNSRMAWETWLAHVSVPREQVHSIPGELGAAAAAAVYGQILVDVPAFDLVLLGLGEDGHTASLFPGHEWGEDATAPDVLAVFGAPKPPEERVSLSARRLALARRVLFLVTGAAKRKAVAEWRRGEGLPAAAIRPAGGVDVLVDQICW